MTTIKYAGQNGFIITKNNTRICFDLYLSDCVRRITGWGDRNYPSPIEENELREIDYYFISHDHLDHMDVDTIELVANINKKAVFVCPCPYIEKLIELGVDTEHVVGAKAYKEISFAGNITVTPIPEKHEEYILVDGEHGALGYVVDFDGMKLYHAGDVVADKKLADDLRSLGPYDVMFVPINGHDWKRYTRNLMGNMTYREALDICDYAGTEYVVPMHYDLFDGNTENPAFFVDYLYRNYREQKFKMFVPGEVMKY